MLAGFLTALALAAPGSAAPHSLEVRVSRGASVYTQAYKLVEGEQLSVTGAVTPRGGGPSRDLTVKAMLRSDPSGALALGYQLWLVDSRSDDAPVIEGQGVLALRPGDAIGVIECGRWAVDFFLDGSAKKPAAWVAEGALNHRVTIDVKGSDKRDGRNLCRQVNKLETQGSVVDRAGRTGTRPGTIIRYLLARSPKGGFRLEYQLDYTPPQGRHLLQVNNTETMTLGRPSEADIAGYRLGVLAEGPAAPAPAAAPPPVSKAEGAVPFLR